MTQTEWVEKKMVNEQSDTKISKIKKRVADILSFNAELKNQMESILDQIKFWIF